MKFDLPTNETSIIKVIGVGGGGGNAVAHMFDQGIVGVDFAICNTDAQAMKGSKIPFKISLGPALTEGRGAGSKPSVGKEACIESIDDVRSFISDGTKMLFITAGMGGGTGTGAAPIIAKAAQEMDILTVGIVTLPFKFEGMRRQRHALEGLEALKKNVDAIIVISNEKLKDMHGQMTLTNAFHQADDILTTAAKGIAEIITVPGYINVDFEDVNTVMKTSGVAIMGSAIAEGDERAKKAIEAAINSPLLEDNDIRGAKHILLNITSGVKEITMDEIDEITTYVQEEAGYGTDIIWGNCNDESLGDKISITLIATGFTEGVTVDQEVKKKVVKVPLDDALNNISGADEVFNIETESDAHTVDFDADDVKRTIDTLGVSKHRTDDPYVSSSARPLKKQGDSESDIARRRYHRNNTSKPLDNPDVIAEMESTPAYARRNVELEDVNKIERSNRSNYTVSMDEDGPIIQRNNSFLHDNVD